MEDYTQEQVGAEALPFKDKALQFFVGRESEIEKICRAFTAMQNGHPATILISGEAGTGKTSLLGRACGIAKGQASIYSALGTCSLKLGRPEPYWPFREIFRSLFRQSTRGEHSEGDIEQPLLTQLLVSLPELCSVMRPDLAVGTDHFHELTMRFGLPPIQGLDKLDQISQEDIFNQFVRFLSYLCAYRPLVIGVDNLHWADDSSLDLFCYVCQNLPERTLLLGTYRSESLIGEQGNSALRQAFNELRRQGASQVPLDPRSGEEKGPVECFTAKYLEARFANNTFPNTFSKHFAAHTGGNPLFMGELLTYAIQQGHIINDGGHWTVSPGWDALDLPESLEAVVEERIQSLTERLRDMLACASVQGHDFTAEVLARVQDEDTDSVMSCLLDDLGKSHNLINEKGEQEISPNNMLSLFQFRNSLIQQQLYRDLGVVQRRRLHKKVAECLEAIYGDNCLMVAPQLAFHFRMARDIDKALMYELETAKRFARQIAFKEAVMSYRAARDLAAARPAQNDDLIYSITLELADLLKKSGNLGDAIEEYSKITTTADSKAITRAWALNGIGDAYRMQGDLKNARPFYEQCEALATELQEKTLMVEVWSDFAHLYHRMAVESRLANNDAEESDRLKDAELYANRVLASAEILGDWDHARKAHMVLGNLRLDSGNLCAAEDCYRKAAAIAEKYDLGMVAQHGLGEALRFRGRYEEAKSSYEQYRQWAIGHGILRSEMIAYNDLGLANVALGDFNSAKQMFEKSLEMNEPIRRKSTAVISMAMLGFISEHGGDQINAIKHYLEATRLAKTEDISSADLCDARNAAARVLAASGEYPGAIMLVADCSDDDTVAADIRKECYRVLHRE
jgi:tetratricopeptide (TPR) repeat protein